MATGGGHGIVAASDLSAKQHYCIDINSSRTASLCAAAAAGGLGVMANKPEAGEAVKFYTEADITGQVYLGATVTVGGGVTSDGNGAGVLADADDDIIFGMFLEAGVAGDTVKFLVRGPRACDVDKEFV